MRTPWQPSDFALVTAIVFGLVFGLVLLPVLADEIGGSAVAIGGGVLFFGGVIYKIYGKDLLQKYRNQQKVRPQQARQQAQEQREKEQREREQARRHEEEETRRQQERANERRAKSNGAKAQDWWVVLGTAPDATLETAKQAYRLKMMQYHPDRVEGLGPEIVEIAEQKSKELNVALDQAKLYART